MTRGWHGHHGPWHHGPPWRRHRRSGMHKQIFVGFGVAIGVTVLAVWGVFWLVGGGSSWKRELERGRAFIGDRFARVWDDGAARRELGTSLSETLDLGIVLTERGRVVDTFGEPGSCRWDTHIRVGDTRDVEICLDRHGPRWSIWVTALVIVLPASALWMLAGLWARRLARPLRELTQVARDLGDGKLERRARLRHGLRGEVGELTHAVNEMATRIEKQIKEQRELLAAVSHELRTPLARVRVLLEIGRDQAGAAPEEKPRDVLGEVEAEVVEMDQLVGDLLANARLDFSVIAPRPLDPVEVAERALSRAGGSGRLEAPAPSETAPVPADPTLLARALAALLDNAAKHGGGAAVLRVVDHGDRVAFEVDDEGPGIPEPDLPRVFDPFFRAGQTRPAERPGLGLGLAIVRRIAEAHGGRAYARNLAPRGASVGLEIPRQVGSRDPA